jgi:alkanesulfonate monooxygenase SsuD/methylene tetrahydromethanopterin reductase-like flavin-dependent oxidoreductase (luciferase family)
MPILVEEPEMPDRFGLEQLTSPPGKRFQTGRSGHHPEHGKRIERRRERMDIGIGLPNAVVGVDRAGIVDWARRAEAAGFASLGTIGRIAYPNYEELIALAAAAAVTERIRLTTDILLAPLRSNTALLAKQTATLDSLSGGRLVLGLAPGRREDDYEVSGVDIHERGRIFDRQLEELAKLWKGDQVGPPTASGDRPTLLIGGEVNAPERAARHADGWTQGGAGPDAFKETAAKVDEAWKAAGREGTPYKMALFYFGLGPRAEEDAREDLADYYAWLGDEVANMIIDSAATDEETLKSYLSAFEAAGADEVICFPTSTDPGQVEPLAEAVL